MKIILLLLCVPLLSGCPSLGFKDMTADQIKEAVKDETTATACFKSMTATLVIAKSDKGAVRPNSSIQVAPDCTTTITNGTVAK